MAAPLPLPLPLLLLALALALALGPAPCPALRRMEVVYTWGTVDFQLPTGVRQRLLADGSFVLGNSVPFDVDVDRQTGRVFLALPWILRGVPVTLATVAQPTRRDSPLLAPYPDWSWHHGQRGCDGLTSVFRIFSDECGRLWVIDSGVAEVAGRFEARCPPQLLAFDVRTGQLLARRRFGADVLGTGPHLLLTVVVEQLGSCCGPDAFAYIADASGARLVVYSLRNNSAWAVRSQLFAPEPAWMQLSVSGERATIDDGLLGLALERRPAAARRLFFHALASDRESAVPAAPLRSPSRAASAPFAALGRRRAQSAAESVSSSGILFFSQIPNNTINCWNTNQAYSTRTIGEVERDDQVLRFVTGLKVLPEPAQGAWGCAGAGTGREYVWAVANNAQRLFSNSWRPNATGSIWVVRGAVDRLTAGPCAGSGWPDSWNG